jgi:regulatory protein
MSNNFLWNRVLGFISKRERCEKEVREYLKRLIEKYRVGAAPRGRPIEGRHRGLPLQNIDDIIAKLKSLDFLNEERFAKAYIHDNYHLKHKGKNRIRQELKNKGINEVTIDKYLNEIRKESEAEKALELAQKRHELIKNLPVLTIKRRLYGLLVRRGFSPQVALDAIDMVLEKR